MAQRDYDLCAFGEFAHRSFNDFGKEQLAKKFKEHFKEDDWYGGLKDYVEESGRYLKLSAEGKPVSIGTMPLTKLLGALISLLLGLLASILAALWLRKKMISVSKESMAEQYLDMTGSEITHRSDRYTHTTENRDVYKRQCESRAAHTARRRELLSGRADQLSSGLSFDFFLDADNV